jgi:hypothetical protein
LKAAFCASTYESSLGAGALALGFASQIVKPPSETHWHSTYVFVEKRPFRSSTYVECQCITEGFTICEANPNATAPAPCANLSYVDAQKAGFKKRARWGQA